MRSTLRAGTSAVPRTRQRMEAKPGANLITEPARQTIAEAAYYLWLQRGGDAVGNWLEAETTLRCALAR